MQKVCLFENGELKFAPQNECKIPANDAAANFGDGVYEVIAVAGGKFVDFEPHIERLKNSLALVQIELPSNSGLIQIENALTELLKANNVGENHEGYIYFRITRGTAAERDFKITESTPAFYAEWHEVKLYQPQKQNEGDTALIHADTRWFFKNIKSLQLMPSRLAKLEAEKIGGHDVVFVSSKNIVTEGGSTNLFIVKNGEIFTHPLDNAILAGITRMRLIELAEKSGYKIHQKKITLDDLLKSDEVFRSSTSIGARGITKVIIKTLDLNILSDEINLWQPLKSQLGEHKIGNGEPGPITLTLNQKYSVYARNIKPKNSNAAA